MSTKTKSRTPKKVLPKPVLVPVSKSINQQRPHFAIGLAIMMLSLLVVGTIVVQRYIRDHGLTHAATNAAAPVINKVSLSSAKSNLVIGDTVTLTIETHGAGYLPESVLVNGKTVTGFRRNQAKGLAVTNGNSGYVAILPGNGDGTFATNTYYNTGTTPSSVAFGDLNNDGLADLAVTNASSSTVSILINQGDDTFLTSNLPSYITGKSPYSVAIGDLNNDGHPDLAVANYLDNTVSVLINQGDGTFAAKNDYMTGTIPYSVAIGDLNKDGRPDLAVANYGSNTVSVLFNQGDGKFLNTNPTTYATGTHPASVAIGDLNNDGLLDLAVANNGSNTVSVLFNQGKGIFLNTNPTSYGTGTAPKSVAIGDLNNDGLLDLAMANYGSNTVSVLLNQGEGKFALQNTYNAYYSPNSVAIGDLNNDGLSDLAVADYYNTGTSVSTVSVLLNHGKGSFVLQNIYTGMGPNSVAIGDVGTLNYTATYTVTAGDTDRAAGKIPVSVTLRDAAGNLSNTITLADTNVLALATHQPTNVSALKAVPPASTWTNDNTVQVSWGSPGSDSLGVAGYNYTFDHDATGSNPSAYTPIAASTTTMTNIPLADGTWYFHIATRNNAGTFSTIYDLGPFKIITAPPKASVVYSQPGTVLTGGPVVATIVPVVIAPDNPVTVTNNSGSPTYTFAQNGSFDFHLIDAAGNTSVVTATVSNIGSSVEARARSFVERMYTRLLQRVADQEGVTYWYNRLIAGQSTKLQIINAYLRTDEYYRHYVAGIYREFMNRDPDQSGLDYWTNRMLNGLSKTDLIGSFAFSTEYLSQSNSALVASLYQDFMNRTPDPDGVRYWVAQLSGGAKTKQVVIRDFFNSYEFNAKYVQEQYQQILERAVDAGGEQDWVVQLQQGLDRMKLTMNLLDSDEFWNK